MTPAPPRPARRAGALIGALLLVFAAVLLAPVPDADTAGEAGRLLLKPAPLTAVGNSVLSRVSPCDRDARTLPDMLAADAGARVLDLGRWGQSLQEGVAVAAMALRRAPNGRVVVFLSPLQLTQRAQPALQTQLFWKLAAGGGPYRLADVGERFRSGLFLAGRSIDSGPFTYKGVAYPAYVALANRYFSVERARQGCPSTLGVDQRFIEANYWVSYLGHPVEPANLEDLARLSAYGRSLGRPPLVVLMPVDLEDVSALDAGLAAALRARTAAAADGLRRRGVDLLDLSDALPAEAFTDRWCACGHLAETGRRIVAARTAQALAVLAAPRPGGG